MVLEPARSPFQSWEPIHLFSDDSRPRCTSGTGRWNTELIHLPHVLLSVLFWAAQPPKLDGNPWKGGILISHHLSGPIKCFQLLKMYKWVAFYQNSTSCHLFKVHTTHILNWLYCLSLPHHPWQSKDSGFLS